MEKKMYFIFSTDPIDRNIYNLFNINFLKEYVLILSYKEMHRLLGPLICRLDKSKDKIKLYLHLIEPTAIYNNSKVFYNDCYYNDCNLNIYNLLVNFPNLIGSPSDYQNNIFRSILFGDDGFNEIVHSFNRDINQLIHEDGWQSLNELFKCLKLSKVEYIVLRKFEQFPDLFDENDKDIDVLCMQLHDFVRIVNAKKRSIGISGYKVKINNQWVSLDIRFVGDNYFDANWELKMLKEKIIYKNIVYIMNQEDLYFSSIYHACTQKECFPKYYKELLKSIRPLLFKNELFNEKDLLYSYLLELKQFMESNNYKFQKPLDNSVTQNNRNIRIIKNNRCFPSNKKIFYIKILSKLPKIPKKLYLKINEMR